MAEKKPAAKKGPSKEGRRTLYKVQGSKLERKRRSCPKCGPGTFMAEHENRLACGRCGYAEFKK
ncbi:MAG: 30S ribosomal protein S27ae [Methanobacteriota archaeon]